MLVGQTLRTLRGVRTAEGTKVDVSIGEDGVVTDLQPASDVPGGDDELAFPDWLVLPSAVEPHAHLDKALSFAATGAEYTDLRGAIDSWRQYCATMTEQDVARRARAAVRRYLAAGVTAMRSHVDLLPDQGDPLRAVRPLLALRDELRHVMDLQVCLLVHACSPDQVVEQALDLGADVLGGVPHLADDPIAETNRLLDIAQRRGVPVDLHTDEQLNPRARSIVELARQTTARRLRHGVTASHCVSLGSLGPGELGEVLGEVAAAGLNVVTLPITNLYLQGRDSPQPTPRGLTAVRALLAAGVTVAAGGDNLGDPFNPVGRADPFEATSLLITAGYLDAQQALTAVTDAGRTVLGLPAAGVTPGQLADLVVVQAENLFEAVAGPTGSRVVLRRGRVVASTSVERDTALDG